MNRNFTRFAFTESVKKAQERYGTRHKAALILMDYPSQQRLKIWVEATIMDVGQDVELAQQLRIPDYEVRIERLVVRAIQAWDWNCPQHITPRYTIDEIKALTGK